MANTVEVTFQIDQSGAGRAALRQIDQDLNKIGNTSKQTGGQIDSAWQVFKGSTAAQFFQQATSAAVQFGKSAVSAAVEFGTAAVAEFNKVRAAQLGLASIATFKGLNKDAATEAVANLEIVKSGLLSVSDASEAVKNFLKTGFNMEQSIALVKRFGDTAAFGRTASLSFGDAVRSGSEGVAIQSSQLLNNVGIVENLATMMQRHNLTLDDLSDKTKGGAASTALFGELMDATAGSVGNATTLTGEFAGRMAQAEAAEGKFLQGVGKIITENKSLNEGMGAAVALLQKLTTELADPSSSLSQFFDQATTSAGQMLSVVTLIAEKLDEWRIPDAITTTIQSLSSIPGVDVFLAYSTAKTKADAQTRAEAAAAARASRLAADAPGLAAANAAAESQRKYAEMYTPSAAHPHATAPLIADQVAMLAKLNSDVHADNPFVTLFDQGRAAQVELFKASKGFTSDLRARLMELQGEAFKLKVFALDASNQVAAAGLRASAAQLLGDRSFEGAAADRAVKNVGMLAESRSLNSRGSFEVDKVGVALEQIRSVAAADLSSTEIAKRVEQITSSFDLETLSGTRLGGLRAHALDTLGTAAFSDPALDAAKTQFAAITALRAAGGGGAGQEAILRGQFLSVAGGLRPDQMDSTLREQVVQAKQDEAKNLETQKQQERLETEKFRAELMKLLTNFDLKQRVAITLLDKSNGSMVAEEMGVAPTPESSGTVTPGYRDTSSGFRNDPMSGRL